MFLKSVQQIQVSEATKRWSVTFTEHQTAVTKVCGLLFLVQVGCWTPYAVLCLWTIILPPESLNVHYTLLPSVCCKVLIDSLLFIHYTLIHYTIYIQYTMQPDQMIIIIIQLAPVFNALIVWWNIPRLESTAWCDRALD